MQEEERLYHEIEELERRIEQLVIPVIPLKTPLLI